MLAHCLLSFVNIQSIFIMLFLGEVNLNVIFKRLPLCLSLQWRITHARLTPVFMEGAVCRRAMAIAATVLRASLEKAARSVSHCQVSAERGNLRGQQLQTAVSLRHIRERETGICWVAFTTCTLLYNELRRKTPGSFPIWVFFLLC